MRLRYVADVNPIVDGLTKRDAGRTISFLPLETIWYDERFDPSRVIAFTGDVLSYNPVAEGDILLPKVSPTFAHGRVARAAGLAGGRALATSEVFVIRAHDAGAARFLIYRLRSRDFRDAGVGSWTGVAGLKRVSADFVRDTRIDAHAWSRRELIVDFLDRECSRVDRLALKMSSLLVVAFEDLESTRERMLLSAGDLVRLKYGLTDLVDTAHATCPEISTGDHFVIRTTGVRHGVLDAAGCYRTDDANFALWTSRREPRPGDVVFTREAPAGEAAVIPPHGSWCLGQRSVLLVLDRRRLNPDFVVLAMYGRAVKEEIALRGRSTTAAHVNVAEIGELRIPIPSLAEQAALVENFLREQARNARLRAITHAAITTLAEHRDALITEAVTGQLDVTAASDAQMDERMHEAVEAASV